MPHCDCFQWCDMWHYLFVCCPWVEPLTPTDSWTYLLPGTSYGGSSGSSDPTHPEHTGSTCWPTVHRWEYKSHSLSPRLSPSSLWSLSPPCSQCAHCYTLLPLAICYLRGDALLKYKDLVRNCVQLDGAPLGMPWNPLQYMTWIVSTMCSPI